MALNNYVEQYDAAIRAHHAADHAARREDRRSDHSPTLEPYRPGDRIRYHLAPDTVHTVVACALRGTTWYIEAQDPTGQRNTWPVGFTLRADEA